MLITEKAPAKLNLSLDTPRRYFDGMLKWDMVMVSADLADYVTVEIHDQPGEIKVYTDSSFLPNDQRNLAFQAANILRNRFHRREGLTINIKKNIPVAAGLGGGSSDAAAVLRILNSAWDLGLSLEELARLSLSIDSDVPYCVYGKLAHVTEHGEKIELLPHQPHYWVVIAKQQISVSTPQILRQIDYTKIKHLENEKLIESLENSDWQTATKYMGNVLEPLTMRYYPEIKRLKDKMIELGADVAQMSGTGPSVFAICHTESRARRVQNGISGFCRNVNIVTLL
ncbi:MAG: 4-(cytidine 5'-diphospho)-2-C-methyl-D-erythritol kinase [Limosilactobacillus sp.]|jgi:4-diphosphocytidyl-2-C-methyl-D-erythritol kinase|uniref:4-(cytidine 5'-diphospho)-2-C-methyl-D-erythritol kinase n=1 Tax=Limosilactobacillus sp. TaxID=2773925 RepID=UPI0025C367D7|nr:4-(cytidine 5'-diphospho)-2-C-methyl-D-erythritol kinase [Limosilactobacillus sp.]MCI1974699.1 4-(cytidine 5'-diphospho)-2-C-methyl-D-erythritol kinase [Limosilactobacillus sp.]MCI2030889.1 4-(cytidine 5'-diphospho)-2-C-methyl-D-erythritol kinase [Limosilactobacillus sp.]